MATNKDFIEYVCEQVYDAGDIAYKKMFGEYMFYCRGKPVLLVCDNTVFIKQLPETLALFEEYGKTPETGIPYDGAKPHYILDVEENDFAVEMVTLLAKILLLPKPKRKKK